MLAGYWSFWDRPAGLGLLTDHLRTHLHPPLRCPPLGLCLTPGLATKQHLENPSFVNYLKYLQYWKQPAYAKHIT